MRLDFSSSAFSEPSIQTSYLSDWPRSDALILFTSWLIRTTGASSLDKKEAAPLTLQSQKNLPLQHLDIPRRQGIYLGFVGGPLLTEVKSQGSKKAGYDIGLFAGYTLNKKFSIETGFYYTHQYFYVSGEYYNGIAGINYASSAGRQQECF